MHFQSRGGLDVRKVKINRESNYEDVESREVVETLGRRWNTLVGADYK